MYFLKLPFFYYFIPIKISIITIITIPIPKENRFTKEVAQSNEIHKNSSKDNKSAIWNEIIK